SLTLSRLGLQAQPVVNEEFLRDLAGLAQRLQEQYGAAPPTADGLLALRGVLDAPEATEDEGARAALDAAILAALDVALDGLGDARRTEGEALGNLLLAHLDTILVLTQRG